MVRPTDQAHGAKCTAEVGRPYVIGESGRPAVGSSVEGVMIGVTASSSFPMDLYGKYQDRYSVGLDVLSPT